MRRTLKVLAVLGLVVALAVGADAYTRGTHGSMQQYILEALEALIVVNEGIEDELDGTTSDGGMSTLDDSLTADGWTIATIPINVPAGATTELVATAGAGKKIRVIGMMGMADVSGTVTLQSAGDAISGAMLPAARSGWVLPCIPAQNIALHGWCDTADNEALNITTVTCTFDGILVYATED